MSHEPRFPVEPLSEKRWQEIRRKVMAEAALASDAPAAPTPVPRGRIAIGVFAAVAAAAALVSIVRVPPRAALSLSRVVTDASTATASAGDATVSLAEHTSVLVIERSPDTWIVSLESGSAHFDVPTRGDRPAFTVEAGRTRVVVVGTAFTVTREPGASSASVSVDHGAVHVTDGSTDVLLHDGEAWPEARARVAPHEVVPSAAEPTGPPTQATSEARVRPHPTVVASTSPHPVAAPAPSARDRYREAESREASDPQAALAAYAELSENGGAWSAPALMSAARLEAELGHAARARAMAERYLAQHPDGINADDARALLRRVH